MNRTVSYAERNIYPLPPRVVVLAAATATPIFPDTSGQPTNLGEVAYRYLQNATGGRLFLSFGTNQVNNVDMWHDFVEDGALFDCSTNRRSVYGYSPAGGSVGTTEFRRTQQL